MRQVSGDRGSPVTPAEAIESSGRLAYLLVGCYAGLSVLGAIAGVPLIWFGVVALGIPLACRKPASFRRACLWLAVIEMLVLTVAGFLPVYGSLIGLLFGAGIPFGLGAVVLLLAAVCAGSPRGESVLAFALGMSIVAVVLAQILVGWLTWPA